MDFSPKVSIIMPVFNGSNYLREAIDSALAQSYKNNEVIVVNDGSGDEGKTEAIALSYGDQIRYFYKENGGVSSALNYGIRKMTGEYFSWLSHDDAYYPHKIAVQIDYLSNNGDKNIILYSDFDVIDHNSQLIKTPPIKHVKPGQFRYGLLLGYPIHGCSVLVPKICFDRCGFFDEQLAINQDHKMWFQMAEYFTFEYLPQKLVMARRHTEQVGIKRKERVLVERDGFYLACLKALSVDELLKINNERAVPLLLMELAINWRRRKAIHSSDYALQISRKLLYKENILTKVKCSILSLYCLYYDMVNYSKDQLKKIIALLR